MKNNPLQVNSFKVWVNCTKKGKRFFEVKKHACIIGGELKGSLKSLFLRATVESVTEARLSPQKDSRVFVFIPRSTMLRVKLGEENSMGWGSFPKRHFSGAMGNRISKPPIDAKKQNGSDYISLKSNKQSMNNPMHLLTGVSSSGSFLLVGLFA